MEWTKRTANTSCRVTAPTVYVTEGFKVWKGKYYVFSIITSANEWHLERLSDNTIVYSAKTAKECMKECENWHVRHRWLTLTREELLKELEENGVDSAFTLLTMYGRGNYEGSDEEYELISKVFEKAEEEITNPSLKGAVPC